MGRGAGVLPVKKKSAGVKQTSDKNTDITVYAEQNYQGNSQTFELSNTQFKTNFDINFKEPVKSIIVSGNPWVLYPEPSFAGRPTFLEEGKYKSIEDFKIEDIGSIKRIDDNLEFPSLMVYESSKFAVDESDKAVAENGWRRLSDRTMRQLAVGGAGVWGVAKDNTLWFRGGSAGKASIGDNWTRVQSAPIKSISVGPNTVWCLDNDNHVQVRTEVSAGCPGGRGWASVDGEYKSLAVSSRGHVWAVDTTDRVWWRKGAKTESATGSGWKCIAGSLTKVAAGPAGVWGLDSRNQVLFRDGTAEDPDDADGSGWSLVDGKFIQLAVGAGYVWGLGANREFFYRAGIEKNTGTHWLRVEQPKECKVVFKQLDVEGDMLVATDKDNNVFYKIGYTKETKVGCVSTLYGDSQNFDLCNFPSRGSTYKIGSGGWVVYAEPNFQGKFVVHLPGECISNDPVVTGETEYKPWSGPFGSARPIRGLGYRTLICQVEPEWDKAVLMMERELLESLEHSNDTYDTCPAPWLPTREVSCSASHTITLQQPQNVPGVTILGTEFSIPNPEPLTFKVRGVGSDVTSGPEFHHFLSQPFTFETETDASKVGGFKKVATLPRCIHGKTKITAVVNIYKCTAKVPCKVLLKMGFLPKYSIGTEEWTDRAELVCVDRSNVKVEVAHTNLNLARKFSALPNNSGKSL